MSKFPWYIEFENGDTPSSPLFVTNVSYVKPTDGLFVKVDEEEKKHYFAAIPSYSVGSPYHVDWFLGEDGTITPKQYVVFDPNKPHNGFPMEPSLDLAYSYIFQVVSKMLDMEEEVGDIWKLPDPYDCCLYAMTEVVEYLESVLLQVRSNDSRNNKKAEDFDSATELFDVTMMLLRSIIAIVEENSADLKNDTISFVRQTFREYTKKRLNVDNWSQELMTNLMFEKEPIYVINLVNVITSNMREYIENKDPERLDHILELIYTVVVFVIFHPIVQHKGYDKISTLKLNKILRKSLEKKGSS